MHKHKISIDTLRTILSYDPATGVFRWTECKKPRLIGMVAGCLHGTGYIIIGINGKQYGAHVLAWAYVHGQWPTSRIDHRNGISDDNRIDNLRCATHSQNMWNTKPHSKNTSGFRGVYKRGNRYVSMISIDGNRMYLGSFSTAEEASAKYEDVAKQAHGDFSRVKHNEAIQ